jgi:hypothetical protein
VPPLEDMADDLAFRSKFVSLAPPSKPAVAARDPPVQPTPKTAAPPVASTLPVAKASSSAGGFGGFGKGFLSAGKAPAAAKSASAELPTIKAKDPSARPGVLPEVQAQLAAAEGYLKQNRACWRLARRGPVRSHPAY